MRKAGDILAELFKERFGKNFADTAGSKGSLFSSWVKIVTQAWYHQGEEDIPAAAAHSRIRELEWGVLVVEADHPGWVQILQTKQAELLSAVKRHYPDLDIRGISFRLSRDSLRESFNEK